MSDEVAMQYEMSFAEENPLLSNWGRVGRKMQEFVEESGCQTREVYVDSEGSHSLSLLQQDILMGIHETRGADDSIECFSASSPLREVEILKDHILHFFQNGGTPSQVQVFAPDISLYAPFIEAVFDGIPHCISDLILYQVDPFVAGFKKLMDLLENRFSKEGMIALFSSSAFREKFGLKDETIALFRKWTELARIKWGYSKSQRQKLLSRNYDIFESPEAGSWRWGLRELMLNLSDYGDIPVQWTEAKELDLLMSVVDSLADDLAPMVDGTKWTMSIWIRYFATLMESYFQFDPTHSLYVEMQQLASVVDSFEEEVPYSYIERIWQKMISKRSGSVQSSHLQAVSFASLSDAVLWPGSMIALIGMQEGVFPSTEKEGSLFAKEEDYRPKKGESDRYLFLQALLSAKETFLMSYVRDPTGKQGASLPVQELLDVIDGAAVTPHPEMPHDEGYFSGKLPSYSAKHYHAATLAREKTTRAPLIPDFYEYTPLEAMPLEVMPLEEPITIELQSLLQFARHPIRYYMRKVLEINPELGQEKDRSEYLLHPLNKYLIVKDALETSLEDALKKAEEKGMLPLHLCMPLAKEQIRQEVALREERPVAIEVDRTYILENGQEVRLIGSVDLVMPKEIDTLEDKVKFWPATLIRAEEESHNLQAYLEYFLLCQKRPSPLLPKFAKALLTGTEEDMQKALNREVLFPSDVTKYILFRDQVPNAAVMHQTWSTYLKYIFGGVLAEV